MCGAAAEELRICGPCGMGGCRGLGSARGGPHKQHNAASTCPYRPRRPPPPSRLAPAPAPGDAVLPRSRRYTTTTTSFITLYVRFGVSDKFHYMGK